MEKQIYNPRYYAGAEIIQNLRSNVLRRSDASYAPAYEGIIKPIEEERYWTPTVYNSEGEVVPEENDGMLAGIGKFLFGDYNNAADRFKEASIADSWRLFHEKRLLAETTNKLNYVSEAESKLLEVKDAEEYANLLDLYKILHLDYMNAVKSNNAAEVESAKEKLFKCIDDISKFLAEIKVSGKNSDTYIDLFFNPYKDVSKFPQPVLNKIAQSILSENLSWDSREPVGIPALVSWAQNILEGGGMLLDKLFYPNSYGKGNFTKKAIKQSLPSDRWTDYLFEGYDEDNGPSTADLRKKIQPHKDYWSRELEKRKIDAIESSIKYKNGTWYFDPQKINPKFRYYSENNDSGLLGGILPDLILYSFSELGSSWSDWENMALMTMSDIAAGYGAKTLTNFAIKRNPYVNALLILDEYRSLRTAGKIKLAERIAKLAANAEKLINNTSLATAITDAVGKESAMLSSMYFINRMREHETNSEIIDAWSNRVLKNAIDKKSDLNKVLNNTREYLSTIGIPNENMTDIDLIQHALAYDIPTGDSIFEKEKNEARAGLNKVYNENMSLAVKDYVEAIPFLTFLGSALKAFGNQALKRFLNDTYNSMYRGIIDNTIERSAKKIFTNSNLFPKLQSKHVADFLTKKLKQIGWISTLEGVEEGQQHLLQQRYSRGEYDNYNTPQHNFLMSSVLEDFGLATDSVAAYLGILFGDPDNGTPEIRRVMLIGAVSGFLGGGLSFGAASNILPSDGRDNIRNLVAQLRTDLVINKLVADSYGQAQDTAHMNMFYDAMQKHGVTRLRLLQSLEDLKAFKGENVTDEYIDRDIELMNDVYYYINNNNFNESLKNRGINKNSDLYKTEVVNASRRRSQLREQYRHTKQQIRELDDIKYAILRKIYNSSDGLSEGLDPEVDSLVDNLYKAYEEYKAERKKRRDNLKKTLEDILKKDVYQEWELKKAEQDLKDFDENKELNWHDYLEQTLDKMTAYRTIMNSEKIIEDVSSKKDVIDTISRELGLGIDSSTILPYLDALHNLNDELYKALEDEDVIVQNELRKKLNESRKKGQPILPLIENIASRIEKKYGTMPYLNEIDKILQRLLLTRAYYDVLKPIVDVYNYGKIDPRIAYKIATTVLWKSLPEEEKKLFLDTINQEREKEGKKPLTKKGIILEYSKIQKLSTLRLKDLSEQYKKHLQDRTSYEDSGSEDIDAESMMVEAAQAFMDFEYLKFEDIKRINHREYLRGESTIQLENDSKNGDEDAKLILTTLVQSDESKSQVTTNASDESKNINSAHSDEIQEHTIAGLDDNVQKITEAPSDESGPQFIEKHSDESKLQPIRSSQELSLRRRLGLDDESQYTTTKPSDEEEGYNEKDSLEDVEKSSDRTSVEEQEALNEIDDFGRSRYDDFLETRNERTLLTSDQVYSDFLHLTFKYNNTAKDNELPTIINRKIIRDGNGNPLVKDGKILYEDRPIKFKNGAVLKSGGQLAKKLIIPGWFENADKYFMITADESTVQDIKNPDNLVVIMVIQDGQDAYCTFMTGLEIKLNRNGNIMSDGQKSVRIRMETMYYSSFYTEDSAGNKTEHVVKNKYGEIDQLEVLLGKSIILKSLYRLNHPGKDLSKISDQLLWEYAVEWYNGLPQNEKDNVDFLIRKFLSGNRPVYSNEKINQEIQKLRETRNQIINSCLAKDKFGRYIIPSDPEQYKTVIPLNPRTSGGKINVVTEDGKYVFRKLTEGGFGMSEDTEELTRQIQTEEVMLGIGLGERSFAFVPGQKAPIAKLDPDSTGNYNAYGYGHSGKIYYIATTVNGDRRAILLFEKKFRDSAEEVSPEDVEESFTSSGKIKEGEIPTIAELIMRLVTNRISDDVFSGIPSRLIPQFKKHLLNIIVNADPSTWVKKEKELKQLHFAKKQFFFDEETGDLIIALKDINGKYRSREFNINKLYSDEDYRKTVIAAISNNLHWNTDRIMMVDMLPVEFLEALRYVFKNDETLAEYKVAGIDDLTFKKSDLFNEDLSYKKTSLVAWMISTGKLLTSVGDTIFSSPFVYADGARQANVAGNTGIIIELNTLLENSEEDNGILNIQSRLSEFNAKRVSGLLYMLDKQARAKLTEGKNIKDFAILDVDSGKTITEKTNEDITKSLKDSVKKYLSFLKKEYGIEVNEDAVIYPDDTEYVAVLNGQALFTASMNKNKKVIISVDSIDDLELYSLIDLIPVSGVFSTVKSDGTLDINQAREWILNTLGLKKSQVIVTNAILRAVDGKIVYGVTNVCVDELDDVIKGVFLLRRDGGSGIHYHEAFHYVNLLLHTKEERAAIYNMYIRLHPELKGTKNKYIEELLAEEFRQYCEDIDSWNNKLQGRNKLSRILHQFIRDIIDFVKSWKKQDLIKTLYKNIHSGAYKGHTIDLESLDEFIKIYPSGAKKEIYIPGLAKKSNFNYIQDARMFFDVSENIAHSFLDFANIKKVGDIYGINKTTFEKFFEKLERDNLRKDNHFIQDVIDNPDAFVDTINSLLRRYGIVRNNKISHGEKQIVDDDRKERQLPSNEISQLAELYDNYTINKKDNVAFRAKLFLCQIRDCEFVYDEKSGQNVVRYKTDPVTGLLKYVSYDNAWQIITKHLNAVDSYEDIIKKVRNLSKTKAFFAQLAKNLDSIKGDVELETQIFNTVNKHLTKVSLIELSDPTKKYKKKLRYSDGTEASDDYQPTQTIKKTFDQNKKIEILNDNTLKAKKMLPRDWSKDLFSSPLIEFKSGVYLINKSYAKMLLDKLKTIKEAMRMNENLSSWEKQLVSQKVFPELLSLIQQMAIPFDEDVLTEYIMIHIADKSNNSRRLGKTEELEEESVEEFYDAMKQILQDPQASKQTSANISFFINTVFNSKSLSILKIKKGKMRAIGVEGYSSLKKLDEIYEGAAGEIEKMAIAYNNIYPSSRELSITGPGGNLIFPIGENNFMSDITRWINKNHNNIILKLLSTPYAEHSNILEVARILTESNKLGRSFEFKLNVFVGMEDELSKKGVDYFGINSLEDVLSKMLLMNRSIYGGENKGSDMIILPTMADKKTYYALELVSRNGEQNDMFNMPHDLLISENLGDNEIFFSESSDYNGVRRFSNATLDRFVLYFIDEIQSLKLYYDKTNIYNVVRNKHIRKKNFHGKVKNGKMDFSGNGGHFRYFYGLTYPIQYGEEITELNLNQVLEWEYMKEKNAGDPVYGEGYWRYRTDTETLDGFEGIRRRLDEIEQYFFLGNNWEVARNAINEMLFKRIDEQMNKFSKSGPNLLIRVLNYSDPLNPDSIPEIHYANRAIPTLLINGYVLKFKNAGRWSGENKLRNFFSSDSYGNSRDAEDLMLTIIGNFTAQSMISIIEIEKVFAGDPAFYKWKYSKKRERKVIGDNAHDFEVLIEKDTDKIKRLGALLSPGSELRTDFSEEDYKKYPWLKGTKYINATVSDVKAKSIYLEETKNLFTRQMVADILRKSNITESLNERINKIYTNDESFDIEWNNLSAEQQETIRKSVEQQVKPYSDITVSDAQVLIRPHLYRKIRMMLGQWTVIPIKIKYKDLFGDIHETWYSDDEAYNIIENDPNWMIDPEKAAKVSRLLLFPLKMTYFKNDPRELNPENNIAYGLYNKMAIFPAFKFLFRSKTGLQIYNRMNRDSDPLDMLTFESAVKVGLNLDIYSPYKDGTESLADLNVGLGDPSGCVLDENDNESWINTKVGLVTEVQDLKGLRMLLNTEAHTDEERAIGTLMFKILFGNIYDDEDYVLDKEGRSSRKGKEIRDDIMKCIKALTAKGAHEIKTKFYNEDMTTINKEAVLKYLLHVIDNNNLSQTVAEILNEGGTIESLMLRTLFEHSVSSLVNSHVIDIETKGGSAILQSVFGFVSYGSNQVRTMLELLDGMPVLNDGRELCWNEKDGSMEVMLSMNFFKSVVPKKYQRTPEEMRQWLINHDIIKGFKKEINPIFSKLNLLIDSIDYTSGPNLSITTSAVFDELNIKTFGDIISKREKISNRFAALGERNLIEEVLLLLKVVGLSLDTKIPKDKYTFIEEKHEIIEALDKRLDTFDLSLQLSTWLDKYNIKTMQDVINNKSMFILFDRFGKIRKEIENIMNNEYYLQFSISWNTKRPKPKYVMSKPKPFGVGYRIPTQGMSSTFAFTVADVLPEWCGDTIIVPREFTAQTGSDFDVDKLFLATKSFKNGILETVEGDDILNASKGAIANRLLQNYIDVVTDVKNRANARASIDVVTGIIQDSTLPAIRGLKTQYAESMYELTPFFQSQRKLEFSIGKSGIGPFALNITNLSLTQYTHVSIDFSNLPVKLGALDEIVGEDGIRISDWLSAMVNAHVDVAKDPYVFDLNINQATYKFVNLLLRAGKGEATFLFLAQDSIKNFANLFNNAQGLYGNNLEYENAEKVARSNILQNEIYKYIGRPGKKQKQAVVDESGYYVTDDDNNIQFGDVIINSKTGYIRLAIDNIQNEELKKYYLNEYKKLVNGKVDFNLVFDKAQAKKYLLNKNSIEYLMFLAMSLMVLQQLDPYAQELSDLVTVSRIDTKKFGNTIALQRDFVNEYQRFKYGNRNVVWYNTDKKTIDPRERYFSETFLEDKLFTAVGLTRDILSTQSIVSSKLFGDIMTTILVEIFDQSEEIKDNKGNKLNIYDKIYDKDTVQQISNAAENVIRHRLLLYYSQDINKKLFKRPDIPDDFSATYKQLEKERDYTGPIDFTFNGESETMISEIKRLWFGDSLSDDVYERNSIFTNIALIIDLLQNSSVEDRNGKFKAFVNDKGVVINELLNYIKSLPANNKFSIPRLLLRKTNRNTFSDEKNRLISAFNDLLVSDITLFRRLGRDLALYSYFSTYNTNAPNAFFDLVPKEFRLQYDMAIAEGVLKHNGSSIFAISDLENMDYNVECKHMIDSICRNFYTDDKIVPLYEYSSKYKNKYVGGGKGEIIKNIPGTKIPAYVLTTEQSVPYIKLNVEGEIVLYKRKMYIYSESNTGSIYGLLWNLYIPDTKLGIHEGTTNLYELHASSTDSSIFEENSISKEWNRNSVANDVLKFIKESLEKIDKNLAKRKNKRTVEFIKVKYKSTDRIDIQESIESSTHKTIDKDIKPTKNIVVQNKEKYIQDNSHAIIDFSNDSWQDEIEMLSENNQYSAEKDGFSLGLIGSLDLSVSDEEVNKYIEDLVSLYSAANSVLDVNLLLEYRNKLKSEENLENTVLYEKYKNEASKILFLMQNQNLNVSSLYLEDSLFGRAIAEVYTKSSFDFANELSVVSLKKVNIDQLSTEKPSILDSKQEDMISGALKMDKYVDKTSDFIDEPISTGKVQAVTKEMLERLQQLKKSKGSIITNESSVKKEDSFNNKC